MAHFHRTVRTPRLQAPDLVQDVGITNGVGFVSVGVTPQGALTGWQLTLTPEDAVAVATALLVGAYNVQHEYHGSTDDARAYSDTAVALGVLQGSSASTEDGESLTSEQFLDGK